jgi:hypothetical protein
MAKSLRHVVEERAARRCEYCHLPQDSDVRPFQFDHIRARKHAGAKSAANLAWSCLPCNTFKGPNAAGYDPESDRLHRLFNPREDSWATHFAWDGPILTGLTPIGRTTINVLRINQPERVEHRRLLIASGVVLI